MLNDTKVLIVDDDQMDRDLLANALSKQDIKNYSFLENGEELINVISSNPSEKYGIVFLDLNMPKKCGRTALKEIQKMDPQNTAKRIIIVLSTSDSQFDIDLCYNLGAKSFISKPQSIKDYDILAEKIKKYWFEMVKLPKVP